jgi:uncharacterized membrane protein YdbT with pleckstrin-like domain
LNGGTAPLGASSRTQRIPIWQGSPTSSAAPSAGSSGGGTAAGGSRLTFRGQQPGENAIFVRRKHPIFLVLPGVPVALSLIGLVVFMSLHPANVRLSGLFVILQFIFGLALVVFLVRWILVDLAGWLFNIYVLTDRRLMDAEGFFTPKRKEATLDRIQQVQVAQGNIFEYLLHIGSVMVVTAGSQGDLTFDGVSHPYEFADQIRVAEAGYRGAGRPSSDEVEPKLPAIKKVLDEMAKPVAIEAPPAVSLRSFGGFLHRPANVRLLPNEVITNYIFRHWFVLVRKLLIPFAILLLSLGAAGVLAGPLHTGMWVVALVGVVIAVAWGGLVYLNYADDLFILTTDRIIDIDRFIFVFFEGRKQADYTKVQDVRVNVRSIIGRILNYGDIVVETAGRLPNIEMSDIPDPFTVQDLIFSRLNAVKERDAAAAANRQRREYRRMLAATLNELVVEVPEVRQLNLVEASERLDGIGLQIKVDSERRVRGVPPGVIVAQMPSAKSMVLRDSEVRVIISGR